MLVITRKPGESFLIGEGVEITVFEVSGEKVKLGISAPRDIRVVRKELVETESINREAAMGDIDAAALSRALFEKKR